MAFLFVSNDLGDWSGMISDTTAARYDSTRVPYSMQFGDNVTVPLLGPHPAPSSTTVWYHFRGFASATGAASEDGWFLTISDVAGKYLARLDMSNGLMAMAVSGNGTSFTVGTFGTLMPASITEYDIKVDVTGSTVTAELYIGQTLHVSGTMTITNSASLGVARNFQFDPTDALGGTFSVSEFLVSETDTRNARVNMLRPTTAGNYTAWVGAVADLVDDDAASGMISDTANDRMSNNIGAYSGGSSITAVLAVGRIARGISGPANARHFLRKSATDYDGASQAVGLNAGFLVEEWALDPSDSLAWTSADLSGLELGIMSLA